MIEYLEPDLTGAPKETSSTENVALSEVANSDEYITVEAKASNDI